MQSLIGLNGKIILILDLGELLSYTREQPKHCWVLSGDKNMLHLKIPVSDIKIFQFSDTVNNLRKQSGEK